MRHSFSHLSRLSLALAAAAAATALFTTPARADSLVTSASSAGSVSSKQLSDSIGQSSDSSSKDRKVAEGGTDFFLYVPKQAVAAQPLRVGDHVLARQRDYGYEFARAENRQAFLLALRDDWHRELESHPVTL